ncbi:MAG: transcription antitermination factor NusB, partial [Holosporales bacterium]|nr:transcription antitermination factor NusB [Holosporales bacterium]
MDQSPKKAGKRSVARLAIVQALYQQEFRQQPMSEVLEEFLSYRDGLPVTEEEAPQSDKNFFSELLMEISAKQERIDALMTGRLTESWTLDHLDPVVRAILRAGIFELLVREDIPVQIVLNEYIELAKAFFEGK